MSQTLNTIKKISKEHFTKCVMCFLFLFALYFLSHKTSNAESVQDLQNQIKDRSSQIERLQKEIDAYNSKISSSQGEAKTLKSAIANLESQKRGLQNQISVTTLQIQNTSYNIDVTKDKITENQNELSRNINSLINTLNDLKNNDDKDTLILNMLSNKDDTFSKNINMYFELSSLNKAINTKNQLIKNKTKELDENKKELENKKSDLSNLSKSLSGQKTLVEQNTKEKNTLLKETKNQEKIYQNLVADRTKKIKDLESEINSFESKIKYILDKSKLPSTGSISWPLKKVNITQYFGNTSFSAAGAYNGKGHNGVDFGTSVGTPIYSAADGSVMGTGDTDTSCKGASYGKWVLIKHNNGLATLYAHLSVINVYTGQNLALGEQIGLSGNTGYSTGPHLHFTVIASDAVKIFGPSEYKSRTCGTYIVMPYAPLNAYLNPIDYLTK